MSRLKQLKEKRASIFSEIDQLRTAADGREMTAEEQQRWDTLLADYNKADKEVEAEERFEQIRRHQLEQAQDNPAHTSPEDRSSAADRQYEEAFRAYLLSGAQGVTPEQRSLLQERAGLQGLTAGVLIPSTLAGSIEKALQSFGGMFEAGSILTTGNGGDLILPTINDTAAKATIVAEYAQSTKRTPSFSSVTLKAFTYRTPIIPVSQELLQDSAFNLDTILSDLLVESFGRGANEHLTTGTGTGQPKGLVTAATACAEEAAATSITLDNILDLIAGVDSAYAKNGKFMFNRNTLFALAKIKDSDGSFIWQDGARVGLPSTLFGKSYIINDDMAGIGAGNASVLFGDLSKYKIRMVKNFRVIRLNELLAEYLSVGLFGFARLDGTLLDAGTHPVLKLVHAKA
ncbi:MAG: phage major capsid protein [Candidatus Ventricola sp.]